MNGPELMTAARAALDLEMRELLCAIEMCSHVPAASLGYSTGGSQHPSRMLAGGDKGAAALARRYDQARDDDERRAVIEAARAELQLIRGGGIRERSDDEETADDTIARMLKETAGWTPDDVEHSRWKMPARMVRRHRVRAGFNPETGTDDSATAPDSSRVERIVAMAEKGMTVRQIAAVLNVSHPTVLRDLGKRAA